MLLQAPKLAQCHLHGCYRQQPDLSRITGARHIRGCKALPAAVLDIAQVVEKETETSSKAQLDFLARSALEQNSDMGSKVQVPRNKVLTTSMIAHATNKDFNQVYSACSLAAIPSWQCISSTSCLCRFRNHTPCHCKGLHTKASPERIAKAQLGRPARTQSLYPVNSSKLHFRPYRSG